MNYTEAFRTGTIQLEPRLQEYLRRKKFNSENNIIPDISEEREFGISNSDMNTIRKYKSGKEIYTQKHISKSKYFVKPQNNIQAKEFKDDPRYDRLRNKIESNKKARESINNMTGVDNCYKTFSNTNPYDIRNDKIPNIVSNKHKNINMMNDNNIYMVNSKDYMTNTNSNRYRYDINERNGNPSTYHHTPKISYRQVLQPQEVSGGLKHEHDIVDIIGNIDGYNRHLTGTYDYISGETDLDTHMMVPNTRTGTQRDNYNNYYSIPSNYGNGFMDISVEDSLRGGYTDSSKKTVGFRNPFENQFDYISRDISSAEHSVQMRPSMTRGQNKEISRPDSAAYRSEQRLRKNKIIHKI